LLPASSVLGAIAGILNARGSRADPLDRDDALARPLVPWWPGLNAASYALAEKLGFRREAHQRRDVAIHRSWLDTLVHALLEDEYRPQNRES